MAKPEPIGNVGRFLVAEAQGLQKEIPLNDEYVNLICAYFPLDSYCDSYQPASDIDPLLSLPERIYNWLVTTRLPSTNVEVAEFRARVLGCIEALVGYILDYHLQVFLPNEPVPRPDLGLHALFERFSDLAKIYWKERRSLIVSIENLKKATSYLPQVTEPDEYKSIHQSIYGTLKGLSRIFPVIIDIKSVTYFVEELKSIKAFPDWMLHLSRRGREEIVMGLLSLLSGKEIRSALYWREDYKFSRIKLPVEENSLVKDKDKRHYQGWPIIHQLLKPVSGLGIRDMVSHICGRDIKLDPLGELDDSWKPEKVKSRMVEFAREQEHKTYSKNTGQTMSKATLMLSIAAGILILTICIIGVMKYYGN